jgi:alpha-tubulin N-acetyltransferase 1
MLLSERKGAHEFGYDRPSPKLIAFLAKHYSLRSYSPQTNNFVVFDDYFKKSAPS